MEKSTKIILWVIAAIIIIGIIVYWKNISDWVMGSAREVSNVSKDAPKTSSPNAVHIVAIQPNQNKETCDEVLKNINAIKNKLSVTFDPYQKAKLQQALADYTGKYNSLACAGGPPPNPNAGA